MKEIQFCKVIKNQTGLRVGTVILNGIHSGWLLLPDDLLDGMTLPEHYAIVTKLDEKTYAFPNESQEKELSQSVAPIVIDLAKREQAEEVNAVVVNGRKMSPEARERKRARDRDRSRRMREERQQNVSVRKVFSKKESSKAEPKSDVVISEIGSEPKENEIKVGPNRGSNSIFPYNFGYYNITGVDSRNEAIVTLRAVHKTNKSTKLFKVNIETYKVLGDVECFWFDKVAMKSTWDTLIKYVRQELGER